MPKHLYKLFNFLRVYYEDGSSDFAKDSSEKIWDRFRKLSVFFVENPWSGISKVEIRDNADRLIMSVTNHLK